MKSLQAFMGFVALAMSGANFGKGDYYTSAALALVGLFSLAMSRRDATTGGA